jgi:hypothetical protein
MESVANWGVGRPTTVPEAGASATPSPLNGTYLQRLEEPPLGRDPQQRETLVGVALRQADPYPDASALTGRARSTRSSTSTLWAVGREGLDLQRRLLPAAREHLREQRGQDVVDNRTSPRAHRPHHPGGCATRLVRSGRAAHPVREDRDHWWRTNLDAGTAAAPGHNESRSSRTEVVSSCLVCGAACLASGHGGEPTPGEYAPSVSVQVWSVQVWSCPHQRA